MGTNIAVITAEDAVEIYNALASKRHAVANNVYGDDLEDPGETTRWVKHLDKIMEKIGPDGVNIIGMKVSK